jgi:hypothetical protein
METTQQQYKRKTGCIFEGDPELIMNSMVSRIISDGIVSCSDLFESK